MKAYGYGYDLRLVGGKWKAVKDPGNWGSNSDLRARGEDRAAIVAQARKHNNDKARLDRLKKKPNSRKRTAASKRMGAALKKWVKSQKNPRIKLPAKWAAAKVRVDAKGNVQVKISASKVGAGRVARGIKSVKKA